MLVGSGYLMRRLRISQARYNVLVVRVLGVIDHHGEGGFGTFPISGPVLSLVLSSNFLRLVFCRVDTCF